ncbi:hypothetical protein Sme01_06330 [Sphaerisporangium melleum]|uniref:Uncharacterized protein n=2 Tax=Sphaerisporangium melleum TaxID=321316 RepID=A0A917RM63_9ACTN|nr:hypothetical protein GCM10007964_65180 [Sphaerisporangium melleum]GII68157.1 hypothetical protein Sme01_06330 [Sphaerisporangium melleum]
MVKFLRERYAMYQAQPRDPDRLFCCVDIELPPGPGGSVPPPGRSIRLYFQKESLYLTGWSVDGMPECVRVVDADGTELPVPSGLDHLDDGGAIKAAYNSELDLKQLGRKGMENALGNLHTYLTELRLYRRRAPGQGPVEPCSSSAKMAFDVIIRLTAEMARFEPYCDAFAKHWYGGDWDQYIVNPAMAERIEEGRYWKGDAVIAGLPPFGIVILKWAKISAKASDDPELNQAKLDYLDWDKSVNRQVLRPISHEDAKAILGDGVRHRSALSSKAPSSSGTGSKSRR